MGLFDRKASIDQQIARKNKYRLDFFFNDHRWRFSEIFYKNNDLRISNKLAN